MNRYAGVLLSVTSLPSRYGIGCFDQAAYDFVDFLASSGQRYWQILPWAQLPTAAPTIPPIRPFPLLRAIPI